MILFKYVIIYPNITNIEFHKTQNQMYSIIAYIFSVDIHTCRIPIYSERESWRWKSMQANADINSTYRYANRVQEKKAILHSSIPLRFVFEFHRYKCFHTHTHSWDTQMRVLSHNIDWTAYLRVPLEAGSRNIAALRGNRNRRRVVGGSGWDRRWLVAPGETPVVDEETEEEEEENGASLGDNDIAPEHLSCSRVRRITQRGMRGCPGSHQVAPDWLMADPLYAMLLLSPEARS